MATALGVKQEALVLLGQVKLASASDDVESRYLLDDQYAGAVAQVLVSGWWRFAMVSSNQSNNGTLTPAQGYTSAWTMPATARSIHSIGVIIGGTFVPVDWRRDGTQVNVNQTPVRVRTVNSGTAEADWPEPYAKAVAAYLAFLVGQRITADGNLKTQLWQTYQNRLAEAAPSEFAEDPIRYADGDCGKAARYTATRGWWRFAMKSIDRANNGALTPASGYTSAWSLPSDALTIHSVGVIKDGIFLPVDYRSEATQVSVPTASTSLRYISSTDIDAITGWPASFVQAYLGHLKYRDSITRGAAADAQQLLLNEFAALVQDGLSKDGADPPILLEEGGSRRTARYIMELAHWNFAMRRASLVTSTGSSATYTYAFDEPADLLRIYR